MNEQPADTDSVSLAFTDQADHDGLLSITQRPALALEINARPEDPFVLRDSSPAPHESGVAPESQSMRLYFNRPIDCRMEAIYIIDYREPSIRIPVNTVCKEYAIEIDLMSYSIPAGRKITPPELNTQYLQSGAQYALVIPGNLRDLSGDSLHNDYSSVSGSLPDEFHIPFQTGAPTCMQSWYDTAHSMGACAYFGNLRTPTNPPTSPVFSDETPVSICALYTGPAFSIAADGCSAGSYPGSAGGATMQPHCALQSAPMNMPDAFGSQNISTNATARKYAICILNAGTRSEYALHIEKSDGIDLQPIKADCTARNGLWRADTRYEAANTDFCSTTQPDEFTDTPDSTGEQCSDVRMHLDLAGSNWFQTPPNRAPNNKKGKRTGGGMHTYWQNEPFYIDIENNCAAGWFALQVGASNIHGPLPDWYTYFALQITNERDNRTYGLTIPASDLAYFHGSARIWLEQGSNRMRVEWLNDAYARNGYDANIQIKSISLKRKPTVKKKAPDKTGKAKRPGSKAKIPPDQRRRNSNKNNDRPETDDERNPELEPETNESNRTTDEATQTLNPRDYCELNGQVFFDNESMLMFTDEQRITYCLDLLESGDYLFNLEVRNEGPLPGGYSEFLIEVDSDGKKDRLRIPADDTDYRSARHPLHLEAGIQKLSITWLNDEYASTERDTKLRVRRLTFIPADQAAENESRLLEQNDHSDRGEASPRSDDPQSVGADDAERSGDLDSPLSEPFAKALWVMLLILAASGMVGYLIKTKMRR
ncbi:MAG: hypothetical protein KDK30_01870 [Leptospiraceae bacterium]|nr:hypothetical protein [Leptospiraceae bacterium]